MGQFTYQRGDRPLEGFTVERAAGRGGFGEVYYALSDGGRQVALKAITNYEHIELRGISQCMNLKSPHLVTVFDVKHSVAGKPFVVMEYVSGPSLRELIEESPSGLGEQKAAFFLREIAKGLAFLHECGIVHRDLKPSNIFYENGYVKIGDYGLSKAISASRHSGQTITVGTVNYMAPEIGQGCYDRSIDIYALGVLLYEMLTGQVPFFGSSPGEVLMKHLMNEPDLTGIGEPFARVIRKALAKEPAERYATVQELVEDVFGAEHVRNSVSQFSPEGLSVVSEQVAAKLRAVQEGATGTGGATSGNAGRMPATHMGETPVPREERGQDARDTHGQDAHATEDAGKMPATREERGQDGCDTVAADPMAKRQRYWLAAMTVVSVSCGVAVFGAGREPAIVIGVLTGFLIVGASLGMWSGLHRRGSQHDTPAKRRVMLSLMACVCMLGSGMLPMRGMIRTSSLDALVGTFLALAITVFLIPWQGVCSPDRRQRVSLRHALGVGVLGFVLAGVFGGMPILVLGVLAGISLVVQIAFPYEPSAGVGQAGKQGGVGGQQGVAAGAGAGEQQGVQAGAGRSAGPTYAPTRTAAGTQGRSAGGQRLVPGYVRLLWLAGFVLSLGVGMSVLIWMDVESRLGEDEKSIALWVVIAGGLLSCLCLARGLRRRFNGWYRYLIKPLILCLLPATAVTALMALVDFNLRGDEELAAILLFVFPSILFVVVLLLPSRMVEDLRGPVVRPAGRRFDVTGQAVSPHKRLVALLFSLFVCLPGLHRFYVGKIGTGLLWFLTGGLFGVGQLVDVVMIIAGGFRDGQGRLLLNWHDEEVWEDGRVAGRSGAMGRQAVVQEAASGAGAVEQGASAAGAEVQGASGGYGRSGSGSVMGERASGAGAVVRSFDVGMGALGLVLAVVGIAAGLVAALHVPAMMAAGVFGDDVAQEMYRAFGYGGWPVLAEKVAWMAAAVLLLLGATALIIARRGGGPAYMIRAAVGTLGLLAVLSALSGAMPKGYTGEIAAMMRSGRVGEALGMLFNQVKGGPMVYAVLIFLTSVIILAWPARQQGNDGMLSASSRQGGA